MTQMIGCRGEAMKCELCGKKINPYGRYTETIAGTEVNLCIWCDKKIKRNNEILREKERQRDDTKI